MRQLTDTTEDYELAEAYSTQRGTMYIDSIEQALESNYLLRHAGNIDLIFTSPPFPLVRPKRYGNKVGDDYLNWLSDLAPKLANLLSPTGSIVLELGNAWEQGSPEMSTLPLEALLEFKKAGGLHLCQQIICHNPARLPSPAAWVTVKRIRLKDSYTTLWWMSRTTSPKSDNRNVLRPYSADMIRLLKRKTYNAGDRPSGYRISESGFLKDHGGSISPSVIDVEETAVDATLPRDLLQFSGTSHDQKYQKYCRERGLDVHPARMPLSLAAFFINFLTDPGDLVLDPFAGSNTTGFAAESLEREWIGIEQETQYALGSKGRFNEVNDM